MNKLLRLSLLSGAFLFSQNIVFAAPVKSLSSKKLAATITKTTLKTDTAFASSIRKTEENSGLSSVEKLNIEWPSMKITDLQNRYASELKVVPQDITAFVLYTFLDEWMGVRYRYGGDSHNGIDCSAFVRRLYDKVYSTDLVRTARDQFSSCILEKNKDSLSEGDLVFFKIRSKRISHVGVYLKNNYFVHASSSQGVMISNLNDAYWTRYFVGGGIVPKD